MVNRLAIATSPYLLQHQDNPVDWRLWGEEAFAEAKRRDAPTSSTRRYAAATDPASFRELLAEDVRITMPPDPPVLGADAAAEFLGRPMDWRTFPSAANGRPALICYLRAAGSTRYEATVVDVLTIESGKIVASNAFVGAHHVTAFGMPATIEQQEA